MNDLREIKKYIFENDLTEQLLREIKCHSFDYEQNRQLLCSALPEGDNKRSVQVKLNESLNAHIRSKGFSGDIFGLVSFIVNGCMSDSEIRNDLSNAKRIICELLGLKDFVNRKYVDIPKIDYNWWLRDIQKGRRKEVINTYENVILPDAYLNQYISYPHLKWINEGLEYKTQLEFQIAFDIQSCRIVIPIHDRYGNLISVKGRRIQDNEHDPKYLYLHNFNKSVELFNLHRALKYICNKKRVFVFEAEKTCMFSSQFNYRECVAIGGDKLSSNQVKLLKDLGMDISVILVFDKDKTLEFIKEQCSIFGLNRKVYYLYDTQERFSGKDSPTDRGEDVFLDFINNDMHELTR